MKISVKEALTFGGLLGAEVLAGQNNCDNYIESATTIEVTDSVIGDWVKKNQLCIATMYSIRDNCHKQMELVRILHAKSCAGLVICHVGIWMDAIDPSLTALCNQLCFPLIQTNKNITYIEILNPLIYRLMSDQPQKHASYTELDSEIVDLIIGEGSMTGIFKKITDRFRKRITYLDTYCNCLFSDKSLKEMETDKAYMNENFNKIFPKLLKNKYVERKDTDPPSVIYLVRTKNNTLGFVFLEYLEGETTEEMIHVADVLNTICALVAGRKMRNFQIKEHYIQEYITDLLTWNFRTEDDAINRGVDTGINLKNKNILVIINLNELRSVDLGGSRKFVSDQVNVNTLPKIREILFVFDTESIVVLKSDQILILLDAKDCLDELKTILNKSLSLFSISNTYVSIGISDSFNLLSDIPLAYHQAKRACLLGKTYFGINLVTTYQDIFFIDIIYNLHENPYAVQTSIVMLKPLAQYDAQNGTQLMQTLEQLIKLNGNITETAQKMFVHRNTLLHRKNKMVEILGYVPFEMPYLLQIIIALEIIKYNNLIK